MPDSKRIALVRAVIAVTFLWALGALYEYVRLAIDEGVLLTSSRRLVGMWLGVFILILIVGLFLGTFIQKGKRFPQFLDNLSGWFLGKKILGAILISFITIILVFSVRSYFGRYFLTFFSRGAVLWVSLLLVYGLLASCWEWRHWGLPIASAWLLLGLGFHLSDFLATVSTMPFSLSWSEGSRMYYASLFFAERIYGKSAALPYFDASRHLLQSLPFVISGIPLWIHRLWQSLMWVGFPVIVASLISQRLIIKDSTQKVLFIIWSLFFLLLGPVPYQVLVVPMLVLWGFDLEKPGRSMFAIAAAGIWAGLSRFNWAPMAGVIATIIYVLETPFKSSDLKSSLRYLKSPIIWVTSSTVIALGTQIIYLFFAGYRDPGYVTYSLNQKLLWYRLLPNATFYPGVLLAVLLIAIPIMLLMAINMHGWRKRWHWFRLGSLAVVLLVFFFGGLLASTKIGGGTNVHNMDGFILILYIIGTYVYWGSFVHDPGIPPQSHRSNPYIIALTLVIPVLYMQPIWGPLDLPDIRQAERDLNNLGVLVEGVAEDGGEILFLSERQLLAHNYIDDVPLFPEYEKMFLMEMSMAGNMQLLAPFHADIATQRFDLIISEPLFTTVKVEGEVSLAEENNAWIRYVAKPILCVYEPWLTFEKSQVQLLVPRERSICE